MRFVVRSSIVLVVLWFNAAAAQEGYLGHDHDKWHRMRSELVLLDRFASGPAVLRPRQHG